MKLRIYSIIILKTRPSNLGWMEQMKKEGENWKVELDVLDFVRVKQWAEKGFREHGFGLGKKRNEKWRLICGECVLTCESVTLFAEYVDEVGIFKYLKLRFKFNNPICSHNTYDLSIQKIKNYLSNWKWYFESHEERNKNWKRVIVKKHKKRHHTKLNKYYFFSILF